MEVRRTLVGFVCVIFHMCGWLTQYFCSIYNIWVRFCVNVCSLWTLRSLGELLHDVDELVGPVPGRADVDAEEVFLRRRGHGERVPLQLRDGRTVEEDVLAHLHFETALHQLQLQHLGRPHHDLNAKEWRRTLNCEAWGGGGGGGGGRPIKRTLLYLTVCM